MAPPFGLAFHGDLTVIGKRPDGDSMRFVPDSPDNLSDLARSHRLRISDDGSVQLRFEGIDTPEVHYNGEEQPLGEVARDRLLALAGFRDVELKPDGSVTDASPATRPAVVLATAVDPNGRPIAYVLPRLARDPAEGRWREVTAGRVRASYNSRLIADGSAYPTFYTSTPAAHRRILRALAETARERKLGVWAVDRTARFTLGDQESIGPRGQLILPKLFRRCTDYLRARAEGYEGTLPEWLVASSEPGQRLQDDSVVVGGREEVPLSSLLKQDGERISFSGDLLDIVFVEK